MCTLKVGSNIRNTSSTRVGYLIGLLVMLRISIGYSGGLSDQSSCYVKDFYWISGEWVSGQSSCYVKDFYLILGWVVSLSDQSSCQS